MSSASDGFRLVPRTGLLLLILLVVGSGGWSRPLAAQMLAETAVAGTLSPALSLPSTLSTATTGAVASKDGAEAGSLLPGIAPVRVASPARVGGSPTGSPIVLVPTPSGDGGILPPSLPISGSPAPNTKEGEGENPAEILRRLRDPASGPLTISQLAALNDAVKRMEYLQEIEKKIGEMNLGVASSSGLGAGRAAEGVPAPYTPSSPGGAGASPAAPVVLQVVGARGRYAAFVLYNGTQIRVEPGDMIGDGMRVATVSLSGVRVMTTGGGLTTLPFAGVSRTGGNGAALPGQMR